MRRKSALQVNWGQKSFVFLSPDRGRSEKNKEAPGQKKKRKRKRERTDGFNVLQTNWVALCVILFVVKSVYT